MSAHLVIFILSDIICRMIKQAVLIPAQMAVHEGVAWILEIPQIGLVRNPKMNNSKDNPNRTGIRFFICSFSLRLIRIMVTSMPIK